MNRSQLITIVALTMSVATAAKATPNPHRFSCKDRLYTCVSDEALGKVDPSYIQISCMDQFVVCKNTIKALDRKLWEDQRQKAFNDPLAMGVLILGVTPLLAIAMWIGWMSCLVRVKK